MYMSKIDHLVETVARFPSFDHLVTVLDLDWQLETQGSDKYYCDESACESETVKRSSRLMVSTCLHTAESSFLRTLAHYVPAVLRLSSTSSPHSVSLHCPRVRVNI